jgi:imidazoleglycerol phosphate synthase glutamine amidotransferase subunit HisH
MAELIRCCERGHLRESNMKRSCHRSRLRGGNLHSVRCALEHAAVLPRTGWNEQRTPQARSWKALAVGATCFFVDSYVTRPPRQASECATYGEPALQRS